MDDMTWMSSFYESPLQLSKWPPALALRVAAMLLAAVGCSGALLVAWSQAAASAGMAAARALPFPRSNPLSRRARSACVPALEQDAAGLLQ